jgi:hypothetical protein
VCIPIAYASQVGTLITFKPGQVIRSADLNANFTAVKVAVNDTDNKCGVLSNLSTTAQTNLVAAVNEVNAKAATSLTSVAIGTGGGGLTGNGTKASPLAVDFTSGETTYDARYLQTVAVGVGLTGNGSSNPLIVNFTSGEATYDARYLQYVATGAGLTGNGNSIPLAVDFTSGGFDGRYLLQTGTDFLNGSLSVLVVQPGGDAIIATAGSAPPPAVGTGTTGGKGGNFAGGTGGDGIGGAPTAFGGTGGKGLVVQGGQGGTSGYVGGSGGLGGDFHGGLPGFGTATSGAGGTGLNAVGADAPTGGDGISCIGGNSSNGFGGYGIVASGGPGSSGKGGAASFDGSVVIFGDLTVNGNVKLGEKPTDTVTTTGPMSKAGGSFKIDHPLDPENKFLYHSFVESPDMKNVYDGVVVLDEKGEATVELPAYFEALNKDFRYQLTCVGAAAVVYVSKEIHDNRFSIAGGREGLKVSWQVTGIRQDAYANAHRIQAEVEKSPTEKGKLLCPVEQGRPESDGINWESNHAIHAIVSAKALAASAGAKHD